MQGMQRLIPQVHFDLFTEVPEWFFADSMGGRYTYHRFASDVGLIQSSPFDEDIPATLQALKFQQSNQDHRMETAVDILRERQDQLVICDIAPSGIQAAKLACLPVILIENFTWDFIYAGYQAREPELVEIGAGLREIFDSADIQIQAKPMCKKVVDARTVEPVARKPRSSRSTIRHRLQIAEDIPVILVTMGGIEMQMAGQQYLKNFHNIDFILPGTADEVVRDDNLIRLPHHSGFYHPDLVNACDAVIGKLGYSTVAEVYHAGLPFAYIPRDNFPETRPMAEFVHTEMNAIALPYADFITGNWKDLPHRLLRLKRIQRTGPNGADQAAAIISGMISR